MAVRRILKMGEPLLFERAAPIGDDEFGGASLHGLVQDLWDTMAACDGAGLAAPQIGVAKRLVVFGVEANPRYPDAEPVPMTVLINPHIEVIGTEVEGAWEGCLSLPGLRGYVERPVRIRYRGRDADGNRIDRRVSGFHARVVQHECDHLDGILFPMRIPDLRRFGFEDVLFPEPGTGIGRRPEAESL